jgi:predicted NAD-dependent protein-ADP-ribosyltransferase YbiA (DUF1768 family)
MKIPITGEKTEYENFVYKGMNAWGEGPRALELYGKLYPDMLESTLGQPSVLDNGFESYVEVEDADVIRVFNSEMTDLQEDLGDFQFGTYNTKMIQEGKKTTTTRNTNYPDGVYTVKGRKYLLKKRFPTNVNVQKAGGAEAMVKSEAFPTTSNATHKWPVTVNGVTYYTMFQNSAEFIKGSYHKYVYDIKDVTNEIEKDKLDTQERVALNQRQTASALVVNVYSTDKNGYEGLSNFSTNRPYTDSSGRKFATVEAAFQYAKTQFANLPNTEIKRQLLSSTSGAQAKALGQPGKLKGLNVKLWNKAAPGIMKQIIKDSFLQNPDQIPLLMSTGDAMITHFGGKEDVWQTLFPTILIQVRNELSLDLNKSNNKNKPNGLPGIDRSPENC